MNRCIRALLVTLLFAAPLVAAENVYVVKFTPAAATDRAAALAQQMVASYGGNVVEGAHRDDGIVLRLTETQARLYAADPRVQSVAAANFKAAANVVRESVAWSSGVNYSYSPAGDIAAIGSDKFVYDAVGRLVQARIGAVQRDYGYDAFGNRTACNQTDSAGQTNCLALTVDAAGNRNQLSTVQYDTAGNMKNLGAMAKDGYSYDALNMTTRVISDASDPNSAAREFVYTADDERLATYTVNGAWHWTVRDLHAAVTREFMSINGSAVGAAGWTWARDYVRRDALLLASVQPASSGIGTTTYYYHLDHLGTPRRVTDQNNTIIGAHDYLAFGPEASTSTPEPGPTALKYTSHERDSWTAGASDSLDYMHARYYSPVLGRFLSPDSTHARPTDPQSFNLYSYAGNDPILRMDRDGHCDTVCQAFIEVTAAYLATHPTTEFVLRHPLMAREIGSVITGVHSTNISTNATRLSAGMNLKESPTHEGSQVNAMRHTIWQAAIASKYGAQIAERVGNAHEENPYVNLSIRTFTGPNASAEADQTVDLLNNVIGRSIGAANQNANMDLLAAMALDYYHQVGLFTATVGANGTVTVSQTRLPDAQFNKASDKLMHMDENGFDQ